VKDDQRFTFLGLGGELKHARLLEDNPYRGVLLGEKKTVDYVFLDGSYRDQVVSGATGLLLSDNDLIQGLWIGECLSDMEVLSIRSFLRSGHVYHLYAYNDIPNLPIGASLKDANEIISERDVFRHGPANSYATFSNLFRYKLLFERGGWWVDTDFVCLRRFDHEQEYVFASELHRGECVITSGILKLPVRSDFAERCYRYSVEKLNGGDVAWGEIGAKLVPKIADELGLSGYALSPSEFCPIPWSECNQLIDGTIELSSCCRGYAVHLWNEVWTRNGLNKNAVFDGSLYGELRARFL